MNDFAGLAGTAFVAGGTGGIGAAVVEMLAERGGDVAFTYRNNADAAAKLTADHNGRVHPLQLDLGDHAAVAAAINSTAEHAGGLHTLVYAAGPHVPMLHLSRTRPAQLDEQLLADASAFFAVAHAALPHLRRAHGSIVAVTTAATTRHPVRDGLSSVPKAAVEATARGLAVEEGRYGVRVNCVGPGMLTDGMAARLIDSGDLDHQALDATRAAIPLRTFGSARDVAEAVCFLASPRAGFISGQKINVDGGYTA